MGTPNIGDRVIMMDVHGSALAGELCGDPDRIGTLVGKQVETTGITAPIPGFDTCEWWMVDFGGDTPEKVQPGHVVGHWPPEKEEAWKARHT